MSRRDVTHPSFPKVLVLLLPCLQQVNEYIFFPALPTLTSSLNTTPQLAEWAVSAMFLGYACGSLLWSTLSDFLSRKPCVVLGFLIYLSATATILTVHHIHLFLLLFAIQSFGLSSLYDVSFTVLREHFTQAINRNRAFAQCYSLFAIIGAVTPITISYLLPWFGWKVIFIVPLFLSIPIFIWTYFSFPETGQAQLSYHRINQLFPVLKQVLTHRIFLGNMLAGTFSSTIRLVLLAELPFIIHDTFKHPPSTFGWMSFCISVGYFLGTYCCLYLPHRKFQEIVNAGSLFLSLGNGLLLFLVFYVGIHLTHTRIDLTGLFVSSFVILVGYGLIIPRCDSGALADFSDHSQLGLINSLYNFFCNILSVGLVGITGWIHNGSPYPLAIYTTLLILATIFSLYTLIKPTTLLQNSLTTPSQ